MKFSAAITSNLLKSILGKGTVLNNSSSTTDKTTKVVVGYQDQCWFGLFNGEPGNGGVELTGRGYQRMNVSSVMSQTYQSYSLGETADTTHSLRIGNTQQIALPEAIKSRTLVDEPNGGRWRIATHWAVYTSSNGSTPDASGELEEPIIVDTHEIFIIRPGHFEIVMEPQKQFIYYGAYANEAAFIAAIRANEATSAEVTSGFSDGLKRLNTIYERDFEVTEDVTGKYMFIAYPADFRNNPTFINPQPTIDANDDPEYDKYEYDPTVGVILAKCWYKEVTVDNEDVVVTDRSNAYFIYKITNKAGSQSAPTGSLTLRVC